jgi:hypothetical protein
MQLRLLFTLGWCTLAVTACNRTDDAPLDDTAETSVQRAELSAATTPTTPLAALNNANSHVEWFPPDVAGELPEVVISVTGATAALLHPDFVDRVGAVQAYLAVTTTPLPAALRGFATHDELTIEASPPARAKLRAENEAIRAAVTRANLSAPASVTPTATTMAAGCTAGQATWAKNHYGAAYSAGGGSSGSKTCGQNMAFHNATGTTYYCNIDDADCDYNLAMDPVCDANECTAVAGFTTALRARFVTSPGAGAGFQHFADRYRFAYYNCSATDNAEMRRRRNGGAWINTTVLPFWMQIRVGGHGYPPPLALARDFLSFAGWKEDHDWSVSTPSSPMTQLNMVTQTDGFLCGDLIQGFETEEVYSSSCNGAKALCEDTPCTDSCW